MNILIDGYNLLNAANIVATGPGQYTLEKSRRSLLEFLLAVLTSEERPRTTVVFDGREAPPGLSHQHTFQQITVRFSRRNTEADDLIEKLVGSHDAPRRLVVVSSDHRIQRAARRRQATAVDSDLWYRQRLAERRTRARKSTRGRQKSAPAKLTPEEVAMWLEEFGPLELLEEGGSPKRVPRRTTSDRADQIGAQGPAAESQEPPADETDRRFFNPFPEGYGEDLLDRE